MMKPEKLQSASKLSETEPKTPNPGSPSPGRVQRRPADAIQALGFPCRASVPEAVVVVVLLVLVAAATSLL